MAMWRIKPTDNAEPVTYPPEEYWRETSPEQAEDLDFAEIAALNAAAEAEEQPSQGSEPPPRRAKRIGKFLVPLVIAALLLWAVYAILGHTIDFSLLKRSAELAQDQALADLRSAVVTVECSGSSGSGFNISEDGLIVTNRHVVEGGGLITVTFPAGVSASYAASDYVAIEGVDLALIDVDGSGLPCVELSDVDPEAGDGVIFIGNPLGYDWTISEATVNGTVLLDGLPVIYLSGPVRHGSSGSPVFNEKAQVIGVIFAALTDEEDSGLAIPVSYLTAYLSTYTEGSDEY